MLWTYQNDSELVGACAARLLQTVRVVGYGSCRLTKAIYCVFGYGHQPRNNVHARPQRQVEFLPVRTRFRRGLPFDNEPDSLISHGVLPVRLLCNTGRKPAGMAKDVLHRGVFVIDSRIPWLSFQYAVSQ